MGDCLSIKYDELNDDIPNDQRHTSEFMRTSMHFDALPNPQMYLNHTQSNIMENIKYYDETDKISDITSAADHTIYSKNNGKHQFVVIRNVKQLHPIQYFEENHIVIQRISTNITSNKTFFISENNKVFYGFVSQSQFIIKPIHELSSVIDAKSIGKSNISFFICNLTKTICAIINNWNTNEMPTDIITLIQTYCGNTRVNVYDLNMNEPKYLQTLEIENIIQIECTEHHALFLACDGNVYSFGANKYGECGHCLAFDSINSLETELNIGRISDTDNPYDWEVNIQDNKTDETLFDSLYELGIHTPYEYQNLTRIPYFKQNNIRIINIKCGDKYCLALDDKHNVYAWGFNQNPCLENNRICYKPRTTVFKPTLITYFVENNLKVKDIKCSCRLSYAYAENKHFLWGIVSNYLIKDPYYINVQKQDPYYIKDPYYIRKIYLGIDDINAIISK